MAAHYLDTTQTFTVCRSNIILIEHFANRNKCDPGDLSRRAEIVFATPTYWAVNATPVLALLATVLVRRRRERLQGDIGYARARQASKAAKRRLAQARVTGLQIVVERRHLVSL